MYKLLILETINHQIISQNQTKLKKELLKNLNTYLFIWKKYLFISSILKIVFNLNSERNPTLQKFKKT